MPIDYREYHPDWHSISRQIREQAGNRCEFCGAPNGEIIVRDRRNPERWYTMTGTGDVEADEGAWVVKIVLTVAHLNHDKTDNEPSNLRALCQRCHLRWDLAHHQRNASDTRRRRRVALGQQELMTP